MVPCIREYDYVNLAACDAHVRTHAANWEEVPDERGSQKAAEAAGTVAKNELRAEAVQIRSQIATLNAN